MPADRQQGTGVKGTRGWTPAVVIALALMVGVAAMVIASGGWVVFTHPHASWLGAAVTSRLFALCGLITLGCIVGLSVIGGMLWRAGTAARRRRSGQDGAVVLEFTLLLPVALMFVLLMAQASMLMGGNLCVHYAAYCAARSAIVYIPDNANASEPQNVMLAPGASAKYQKIKMAAVWAVMPVSTESPDYPGSEDSTTLRSGLEKFFTNYKMPRPGWVDARLSRKLAYADEYTILQVDPPRNGDKYDANENVRVRLTHTMYLAVPYANRVLASLDSQDGRVLNFGTANYGMNIHAGCTLTNAGRQDYVEPEQFPQDWRDQRQ
jgi:hypothetical protein